MTPEEHPDGNQNTPEATHNQYNTWSSLFNIDKQQEYNDTLCHFVMCVLCWKTP